MLALSLVSGVFVEAVLFATVRGDEPADVTTAARVLALGTGSLLAAAIAWRRSMPLVGIALAIVAAGASLSEPLDGPLAVVLAMIVASYSVAAHSRDRAALLGALGVLLLVGLAIARDVSFEDNLSDLALQILVLGGPWLAGQSIRSRREREILGQQARVDETRLAIVDERARIARELHDAVAHSLGVIVLQARGARRAFGEDPAASREALDAIESTGRLALAEMRRLVGVLRDDDEMAVLAPPPSLRHLDLLIGRVRDAGLPVELTINRLPADLPAGVDLSAYRIVQEALTNSLAHAGPATASVVISCAEDGVEIEVADTGRGPGRSAAGGHGLVGMRERVALFRGTLETGARPAGGFVVRARLPIEPNAEGT